MLLRDLRCWDYKHQVLVSKRVLEHKDLKDFFAARGLAVDWRDALKVKDAPAGGGAAAPAAAAK